MDRIPTRPAASRPRAAPPSRRPRLPATLLLALALLLWGPLAHAVLPIEHWTTSKGARVYFVRADAIPMLDVSLDFDAGARHDPPAKSGLASMTTAMLARGVEGARRGDARRALRRPRREPRRRCRRRPREPVAAHAAPRRASATRRSS